MIKDNIATRVVAKIGLNVDELKTEAIKQNGTILGTDFNFRDGSRLVINGNRVWVGDKDTDPTRDMTADVRKFYRDGQSAKKGETNPYNRYTQIKAFHGWSAGYCDRHGKLPK